jgi:Flp pilus assembly protein TadG
MSLLNKMVSRFETRRGCNRRNVPVVRRDEAGQAIVVVALALVAILGILGLATDIGYLRYTKRQLQTAADAAAIAGAAELAYGDVTSAAQADSAANGFTNGTNGATVAVNNPPQSGQHIGNSDYVEAIVAKSAPTFFAKAFGVNTVTLQARAVAYVGSASNCVFALNPSGGETVSVGGSATLSSQCGIVDEASNNNAFHCLPGSSITASFIGVVGSFQNSNCTVTPAPTTGISVPVPNDPLAYLAPPTVGACTFSTLQTYTSSTSPQSKPSVLNPGVYCGGISIQPGAYVVFNPGTYILTSSSGKKPTGGLTVDIGTNITTNTSVSPNGVMFYNYGPVGAITFNFTSFSSNDQVSLSAPTTGTYGGILFFQDPANTNAAQIIGNTSLNTILQGAYYFPDATVNYAYAGAPQYNILVANTIQFGGVSSGSTTFNVSTFNDDYTSLATGSPVKGNGVLVE